MRRAWMSRTPGAPGALRLLPALLAAFLAAACHDLPDLGTCGNDIVEAANGEACDDGRDNSDTGRCTPRCELRCMDEATAGYVPVGRVGLGPDAHDVYCPGAELRCGTDAICRAPSGEFEPLGPALTFNISDTPTTGDVDNDGLPDLVGASATNIYIRFASNTGDPLGGVVVQEAPSSDAPYVIFDPRPNERNAVRSDLLFAVPTEGVALLQSDGERFAPELELPITVMQDTSGLVVRDPDPVERLGDVVISVARRSSTPAISVMRVGVEAPDRNPLDPAVAEEPLPACSGAGGGAWRLLHIEAAGDRRSFVVLTQRDGAGAQPWHVCRYTHAGGSWVRSDLDFTPPAAMPLEARLANLDPDPCLELAMRGAAGFFQVDAVEPGCGFIAGTSPLQLVGEMAPLLAAGPIVDGGIDELVLGSGLYRACTGAEDCEGAAPGTFVLAARPTKVGWASAAVVDLNGDLRLDAVAARANEADVDIVRGGPVPNVYRAATSAPIRMMVAGDYDGDRLGDVAMAEMSPAGDRLVVLFGSKEGTVDVPRAMSGPNGMGAELRLDRFDEVSWLPSSRGTDGIDDLAIVRLAPGMPPRSGFSLGDAARLMTTPRFPPTTDPDMTIPIDGVAAGAFRGPEVEILAIARGQVMFYNAANLMGAMWSTPTALTLPLQSPVGALRDGPRPARGVAALGPGRQAFVVFSVRGGVVQRGCDATASGMFLTGLRGIDVDGDGVDEVAALSDNGDPGGRRLEIFRAEDSAGSCKPMFEAADNVLAGCVDVANVGRGLVALCRIGGGDTGPARGVFAISDKKQQLVEFQVGDTRFATPGDYDGDGVVDVAISLHRIDEVVVHYLRQCPAHDTRTCQTSR